MTNTETFAIFLKIMRAMHTLIEDLEPGLEELKLEPKEFFLLYSVDENPYPAELARALLLPGPTVSFLIKRVEKAGYLKRETDKQDLRKFKLTLTKSGRAALNRGYELLEVALQKRLGKLNAKARLALVDALDLMSD
ncbi:MAG: MarR family transcriptional regulator [Candidatus Obscuribacter sp.]|nr:MarR family transcriptional regulator [Candidatus Obscuribacter sp.]MBK7840663.1 MarR family transcriptional regulator [Candidatus Obscuribacter sp.]MBK9206694.1 MarR family transcriptional regulator [Candidatus Obscuribacter sp.]MBK9620880.1 MarR family transcriptional regulator [Candidatus Obscuribacter sp.]MBK9771337.1 MarR family transcriptional regulator [Candidatus Obscuribacter sp.]